MGKGEIAPNEQFLFQQCFLLNQILVSPFVNIFAIISLFAAELEEPKIGISGKRLILQQTTKTFQGDQIESIKNFADNKLTIAGMMISLLDRVENTVGKGENAGYQHFLLFPKCFPKPLFRVIKSWDCVVKS